MEAATCIKIDDQCGKDYIFAEPVAITRYIKLFPRGLFWGI